MNHSLGHRELSSDDDECIFVLPKEYGYVIIITGLIAFLCIAQGMIVAGGRRKKFFTPEFMKQFEVTHYQSYSSDITKSQGYPDMGNGIYSQKLPYNQWREFNQAQRVHYNFLEQVASVMFFILATGLAYPWVAFGLGCSKFIGRILVVRYISDKGSQDIFRLIGALGGDIAFLGGFVFTIISGLKISCVF